MTCESRLDEYLQGLIHDVGPFLISELTGIIGFDCLCFGN